VFDTTQSDFVKAEFRKMFDSNALQHRNTLHMYKITVFDTTQFDFVSAESGEVFGELLLQIANRDRGAPVH